jgi:hypothetical protein
MNPGNQEQLAIVTKEMLSENQKIAELAKIYENSAVKIDIDSLIARAKSFSEPLDSPPVDHEKAEALSHKQSETNFVIPKIPIPAENLPPGEHLELGFFIYTPKSAHYMPSINAIWYLVDASGERKLIDEYAAAKPGLDDLPRLSLIAQSLEAYEEALTRLADEE